MSKEDFAELIKNYGDVLSSFFDHLSDMFFLASVEEGQKFRYVMVNPAGMKMAAITEDAYGKRFEEVHGPEKAELLNKRFCEAVEYRKPITFVTHENGVSAEWLLTPLFSREGTCTHVLSVTRDVTERKLLEDKLQYMAYHDTLTGLPNRRLFQDRFRQALVNAKRYHHSIAVLFLDCDNFKLINDTMGHQVGDELLQGVTKRLKYCVRDTDTIARLGGDEFIILLTSIQHEEEVNKIAQRIMDTLALPWKIRDLEFTTTASIGISLYPKNGENIDDLLRNADAALYEAKTEGRNNFKICSLHTH